MLNCLEFKAEDFIPVMEEAISNNGSIALIKDEGIYFVAELPTQSDTNELIPKVAFAKGCNPQTDADWAKNCDRLGAGIGSRHLSFTINDPMLQLIYQNKSDFEVIADQFGCYIIL